MKIAAITGANRGLGKGTALALAAKGYRLILLGRSKVSLEAVKKELPAQSVLGMVELDLAQPGSIERAAAEVNRLVPDGLDLLVNNAGVFLEKNEEFHVDHIRDTVQINTLGPLQFSMALASALARRRANVVNVSSGYRVSKAGLNAVTRYLSEEWKGRGVRVNSVCPGWVKTDMGGEGAERTIAEGVKSILFAALLESDGPTGGFFRDGKRLDW